MHDRWLDWTLHRDWYGALPDLAPSAGLSKTDSSNDLDGRAAV